MKQLSLFDTQKALLELFGLHDDKLIRRVQLDIDANNFPLLTVERYIDLTNTPSLETQFRRFEVKLVGINEWDAYHDHETPRPAFDLDAACQAATQRVLDHIEDLFTVHRHTIKHNFAATRDHMRSRHAHLKALEARSSMAYAPSDLHLATIQARA